MAIRFGLLLCFAVVMLALSAASVAQIGIGVVVSFGPPPLPVYAQPLCPGDSYIWTPGYWAYDSDFADYYWVPGTWVLAPQIGFLWTPGWWGWGGEGFIFHEGFWGPRVGFYGGINYGFGYFGHGYEGGRWENDHFYYNRAVNNVNVTNIHSVYNTTVINNTTVNRVSYNGGNGGAMAQPTPQEQAAARANHIPPVAVQTQHVQIARENPQLRASVNQGKPPIAATPKPAAFQGSGVVPAKQSGGPYTPPPNRASRANTQPQAARPQNNVPRPPENNAQAAQTRPNPQTATPLNHQAARPENNVSRPSTAVHPNELPPIPHTPVPNTGNAEADQKYQQEQEQLRAQQAQERQKLQQQQEQEHQQLAQQQANKARQQQLEQQHQKQTQDLRQQHQQQQEQMARQQQQHMQASQQQAHASQSQPPKPKP